MTAFYNKDWKIMPLDFRYHLASLAAVFGALLIGILLGVAMKEGPVINQQIDRLHEEFVKYENYRVRAERSEDFTARTQPLLIQHRLDGMHVALVVNPLTAAQEELPAVRNVLRQAGAEVVLELKLRSTIRQLTERRIKAIYSNADITDGPERPLANDLMRRLGNITGVASESKLPSQLASAGLIEVKGDMKLPVTAIIYLGGAGEEEQFLNDIDLPFLRGCRGREIKVIATEHLDFPVSLVQQYRKYSAITIDNIDLAAGRSAMVLSLTQSKSGSFGFKDSADATVPESEE